MAPTGITGDRIELEEKRFRRGFTDHLTTDYYSAVWHRFYLIKREMEGATSPITAPVYIAVAGRRPAPPLATEPRCEAWDEPRRCDLGSRLPKRTFTSPRSILISLATLTGLPIVCSMIPRARDKPAFSARRSDSTWRAVEG